MWLPKRIIALSLYHVDINGAAIRRCLAVIYKRQGRTQEGGLGLTPTLELDILQKFYYLRKEIDCFRLLLLVNLST